MSFSRILFFIVILFAIDLYVFQGVRVLIQNKTVSTQRTVQFFYWAVTAICISVILSGYFIDWHLWSKPLRTYSFASIVIIYFSKLLVVVFMLVDDILRIFRWGGSYVYGIISKASESELDVSHRTSRYAFIVKLGFIVGSIPFFSMIYGMMRNAYNYDVRKVKLNFPNLPDAFHGLKVIQISDLHTGSFMGTDHLEKAVRLILDQKPDVILFTGDLVNDRHVEALEFADTLKKIQAPLGVYSILGNHDYGDYYRWESLGEKQANLDNLKSLQRSFGWNLLLNNHTFIEKDGHRIGLIGVENWSTRMNFAKYGDMKKAVNGMQPASFNILLSHDPSHWKAEVIKEYQNVDLTLSGHTHGMQFGIEIPGFKWSPVQYVYKEWADLYKEGNQYLYVNRGLGFLGYPGRVGILPEITLFELSKS